MLKPPHPEVVACGITRGDRVLDRERGRQGTVVALSTNIPGVWIHWDGHTRKRAGHNPRGAMALVHLDEIRLI